MTREQLIASLTATDDSGWYAQADDDSPYLDWSTQLADAGRRLEAGDEDGEAVTLDLTRDELVQLHRALTVTLLADAS